MPWPQWAALKTSSVARSPVAPQCRNPSVAWALASARVHQLAQKRSLPMAFVSTLEASLAKSELVPYVALVGDEPEAHHEARSPEAGHEVHNPEVDIHEVVGA